MTASDFGEQMQILMRGVEYGNPDLQRTMEAELRARLAEGRPLRVYCGFDPTATDLHLGHMVPMFKLRQFQRLGHEVTFLMGTMTAVVGDPTDRTAARQKITREQVEANTETWLSQAFRILDPQKTVVKRNASWLAPLALEDVIELASHFTVAQFLEREGYRQRLEAGRPIYLHEFLYALMQAYDAYILETDVQVGGLDQLFNILAGRELQRDLDKKPLIAVTVPLLLGTDGSLKMSKSVGNYVGLDDEPADMYGKVMSVPDSLIVNWFTLLTDVPQSEVAAIEQGIAARSLNPMQAKKRLASEIVKLLHGAEAAALAQDEFERVFQRHEQPEEAHDLPLPLDASGTATIDLTLVITTAGVVGSRGEARRLLSQGAISINGQTVRTHELEVKEGSIIKVGRHRFLRVVAKIPGA